MMMLLYTSGTTQAEGAVHRIAAFRSKPHRTFARVDCMPMRRFLGHRHGLDDGALARLRHAAARRDDDIYDGAPDWPAADRLWLWSSGIASPHSALADIVRALLRHGDAPVRAHDLSSLRKFGSTGEPWNPRRGCGFPNVGGGTRPIINYSAAPRRPAAFCLECAHALKPCAFSGRCPECCGYRQRAWRVCRAKSRACHPPAVDRHDARILARPGALSRRVLVALSGCLGACDWAKSTMTACGSSSVALTTRSNRRQTHRPGGVESVLVANEA